MTVALASAGLAVSTLHPAAAQGTGAIAGTIRDAEGVPVAGGCASVFEVGAPFGSRHRADQDGRYEAQPLEAGSYRVRFEENCFDEPGYLLAGYHGGPDFSTADVIDLQSGEFRDGIDASLEIGGRVSGRVTDSSGSALSDICIRANAPHRSTSDRTDAQGRYELAVSASGVRMEATPCSGQPFESRWYPGVEDREDATTVRVDRRSDRSGLDFSLPHRTQIEGTVTGPSGEGLPGICVRAIPEADGPTWSTQSRADGTYLFHALEAGSHTVEFSGCLPGANWRTQFYDGVFQASQATVVDLEAEQTRGGIDARMTPGRQVRGTVTDIDGEPIPGLCTVLETVDGSQKFERSTDASGDYVFGDLPAGSFVIGFDVCFGLDKKYVEEWFDGAARRQDAQRLELGSGESFVADAALELGGAISGVIRDRDGRPLRGVCVSPTATAPTGDRFHVAETDARGRYMLKGLRPGSYRIRANQCFGGGNHFPTWFGDVRDESAALTRTVGAGEQVAGIDIVMVPAGGISGEITDTRGQPLDTLCVKLFDDKGERAAQLKLNDRSGDYSFQQVEAGTYRLNFEDCRTNSMVPEWYDGEYSLTTATRVRVGEGEEVKAVDAQLVRAGSAEAAQECEAAKKAFSAAAASVKKHARTITKAKQRITRDRALMKQAKRRGAKTQARSLRKRIKKHTRTSNRAVKARRVAQRQRQAFRIEKAGKC